MNTGVVFATTGGSTILRAVRSFNKSHPGIDVHVIIDTSSNTWNKADQNCTLDWLYFNKIFVKLVENTSFITCVFYSFWVRPSIN